MDRRVINKASNNFILKHKVFQKFFLIILCCKIISFININKINNKINCNTSWNVTCDKSCTFPLAKYVVLKMNELQ